MELKLFENAEFGQVRVILYNGEPWFVAKDVCDCLCIDNARDAVATLDEDEKTRMNSTVGITDGASTADIQLPPSGLNLVSEAGLYSLIFRSRKPEAKAFKRWVTHDVLPQIRKTGRYMPDFDDPVAAARAWADEREAKRNAQAALLAEQSAHAHTQHQLEQLATVTRQLLVHQGLAGEYRTVKSLSWWSQIIAPGLPAGRAGNAAFWAPVGKAVTALCKRMGGLYVPYERRPSTWGEFQARKPWDIMRIADSEFDVLNVYPKCALDAFCQELMNGVHDNANFARYLRTDYKTILAGGVADK